MANILIDPVIITTPPNNASKEAVKEWLDNLDLWLTEALSSPFRWLYAKEAIQVLLVSGQYPFPEILFNWQRKYYIDTNISWINAKLSKFFNNESENHLSFHFGQLGYLLVTEPASIVIIPTQFVDRWPITIRDHMCELLATACACKHNGEAFGQEMFIATLTLGDATKAIEVSAVIIDALPDIVRPINNKINQIFPLLITPNDLQPLFNIVECWDKGEDGIKYAIKQQYKRDWYGVSPKPLHYKFSKNFIASVMERKDMVDLMLNRIIRTMAGVIADRTDLLQYKPHWVREREEPHTPQLIRTSDKATAWRITITHDGAGWRMHYWRKVGPKGDVIIEFSNVLTKNDPFAIY